MNVFLQGAEVANGQGELRELKHANQPKNGGQSSWNHSEALEVLGRERERVLCFSVDEDRHVPEEAQTSVGSSPREHNEVEQE